MQSIRVHGLRSLVASTLLAAAVCTANAGEPIVVVVSAKSAVAEMTADQVSQLYLGKTTSLPGGGAAILIDQPEGTGVRDEFYNKVAGKNASQMKSLWSRLTFSGSAQPPKVSGGNGEVKKAVAETAGAIGYIEKSAIDSSVKVVLTIN